METREEEYFVSFGGDNEGRRPSSDAGGVTYALALADLPDGKSTGCHNYEGTNA